MNKAALLIAVGEYQSDFESLAAAENDLRAMQRVLHLPDAGGFAADAVKPLVNPDPQKMREALEGLFINRRKDDLLVLYFSGHGVTDDRGNFYLASTATQRDRLRATSVSAKFILDLMEESRSKQQVVILDCCFSGAFAKGMTAKGKPVNLGSQLGGQGRAVLTSSSATEYSFEQKDADLSIYTRYLVEGLETGAADLNGDGWIAVDELYEFTRDKVQEAAPAMQPKIYAAEAGHKIQFSKAPLGDPKLEYRKEVEQYARGGHISFVGRNILDILREQLQLSKAESTDIENQVLQPYREYENKLQRFEQVLAGAIKQESPLRPVTHEELKNFQHILGLRDQDVASIELKLIGKSIPNQTPKTFSLNAKSNQPTNKSTCTKATPLDLKEAQRDSSYSLVQNSISKTLNAVQSDKATRIKAVIFGALSLSVVGILTVSGLSIFSNLSLNTNSLSVATNSSDREAAENYYLAGLQHHERGNYEDAIAAYSKAIELDPDDAEFYYRRGRSKHFLGEHQAAISDYDKAIEIEPEFSGAYHNRGAANTNSLNTSYT